MPSDSTDAHVTLGKAARQAMPTLAYAGRWLCSTLDPLREAETWAQTIAVDDIDVLVVFGLGLGYHIEALRQRTHVPIFVVEPDDSVIAAALGRGLVLEQGWVVKSPEAVRENLAAHLQAGQRVAIHPWPPSRRCHVALYAECVRAVERAVALATVTAHTLESRIGIWAEHLLANLPALAGCVPALELGPWLAGRPVIVVSAGPSLDQNVELLRDVGDRAVIIAVNTALRALDRVGVRAHLVCALEVLDISRHLDGLEINRGVPRAISWTANPTLFACGETILPFADRLATFANLAAGVGLGGMVSVGGSVAHAAFSIACKLGAPRIILVGQDLAYRDDRVYAAGTVFEKMRVTLDGRSAHLSHLEVKQQIAASNPRVDNTRAVEEVEPVLAWGGRGVVHTTLAFNFFRYVFEEWASVEGPRRELVNATEGGARIAGFAEQTLAEALQTLPGRQSHASTSSSPRRPLPSTPALEGQRLRGALLEERGHTVATLGVARRAIGRQTAARVHELRAAMARSGLLSAFCWPAMCKVLRNREGTFDEMCAHIVADATRTLAALDGALADPRLD